MGSSGGGRRRGGLDRWRCGGGSRWWLHREDGSGEAEAGENQCEARGRERFDWSTGSVNGLREANLWQRRRAGRGGEVGPGGRRTAAES
ncbi:hypothetical protein E2562_015379 [Oryza meyeriana var. granulata]|uniref:Uncharacterized protein n=1 Tax=Oryza meyeriana var. granulata TaxID=110450 RepID=A0A6G1EJV6_9ORYZ|nr:hypothetical protein E2562_015379 [Oryza meyeriana var. granulata]